MATPFEKHAGHWLETGDFCVVWFKPPGGEKEGTLAHLIELENINSTTGYERWSAFNLRTGKVGYAWVHARDKVFVPHPTASISAEKAGVRYAN